MAAIVTGMMFQSISEGVGSISMGDNEISRRPYHRNCSCALHDLKNVCSSSVCSQQGNVSFSKKKSWPHCALSIEAAISPPKLLSAICQPGIEKMQLGHHHIVLSVDEEMIQIRQIVEK